MQRRPRVLEIGMFCLFKQAWPETTEYLYAGPGRFPMSDGLPERFAARRWLNAGGYDLVVAHTSIEHPLRPGMLARLLSPTRHADARAALAWDAARQFRPRSSDTPIAVLDMHDTIDIRPRDIALLKNCTLYFKRELPLDPTNAFHPSRRLKNLSPLIEKLRPISLGAPQDVMNEAMALRPEKSVDVFFSGSVHHAPDVRGSGLAQLEALAEAGYTIDISRERLSRTEFLARCARARIVWSPEGMGWDCFRHYEAAMCGSVALINRPRIVQHAPLVEGEHALYYDPSSNDLQRVASAALADPERLTAMGAAARDHALRFHTHAALCEYVALQCLPDAWIRPPSPARRPASRCRP